MARSDRGERVDDAQAARIEIAAHAAAARALAEIGGRAVLAGEEPFGEAVIGDDADLLGDAEVAQAALEGAAVVEIVLWLQDLVARQVLRARGLERRRELRGGKIRRAAPANLALVDQPPIGAERLGVRNRIVGPVRQIEVDRLDAEPPQRRFDRLLDIGGRQALPARPHRRADLGDDGDFAALAARLQPRADDRLGFAALVARRPSRIDVGGVDRAEAGADEAVEQVERGLGVGRPAEHIAAEHGGGNRKVGAAETTLVHRATPNSASRPVRRCPLPPAPLVLRRREAASKDAPARANAGANSSILRGHRYRDGASG